MGNLSLKGRVGKADFASVCRRKLFAKTLGTPIIIVNLIHCRLCRRNLLAKGCPPY
ncbi:MAG: hypothetical protein LBK82_09235 [Planctomycetaceae bacterium]|nr:hypothetical protein [Planctomycetaceae bacterium]